MAQELREGDGKSGIARAGKRKWGYDPAQVDAFLERAHALYDSEGMNLTQHDIQSRPAALRSTRRQSTRLKSSVLIEAYQRPLPNARRRMPFQSELTVSGVAAFIPAVCAADCTVDELVAPGRPGLGVSIHSGPSLPSTA